MIVNYATDQDGGKKYRENFLQINWKKVDKQKKDKQQTKKYKHENVITKK